MKETHMKRMTDRQTDGRTDTSQMDGQTEKQAQAEHWFLVRWKYM